MTFKVDPEMIQGTGILGRLGVFAAGIGKRALVFSGEGLVEAASAARVSSLLEDAGVDVISSDAAPILAAADTAEIAG
ncbi:MAG: iron-containing alcohol dehydrogenase, partial [Spirochaetaceae bacterium]|nr:iron-containing alcohol dehydrogenase [Spirochaetaceae bacterium]